MTTPARQIKVISSDLRRFTERVVKALVLETHSILVSAPPEGTPVDTNWARANWIPRIGGPVEEPVGTRERAEAGDLPATAAAQTGIVQVATGYTLSLGPVFLSNAVPYITTLNFGSSSQSPSGFVQLAILGAVRNVETLFAFSGGRGRTG